MDSYGKLALAHLSEYHKDGEKDIWPSPHQFDIRIVTQNVQGFPEIERWEWLSAWRNIPQKERPAMILLQETHVSSQAVHRELSKRWNWMWRNVDESKVLSYWSIGTQKKEGVAILLFPEYVNDI